MNFVVTLLVTPEFDSVQAREKFEADNIRLHFERLKGEGLYNGLELKVVDYRIQKPVVNSHRTHAPETFVAFDENPTIVLVSEKLLRGAEDFYGKNSKNVPKVFSSKYKSGGLQAIHSAVRHRIRLSVLAA